MEERGLPAGELAYDFAGAATGERRAAFDLAWPSGIQVELSQPVAVLLNEGQGAVSVASPAGFRCFTDVGEFKRYVAGEVLAAEEGP